MRKKICLTPEERNDLIDVVTSTVAYLEHFSNSAPAAATKAKKALETLEALIPVTESEYRDLFWTKPNVKRPENCLEAQTGKCLPRPGLDGVCEHCHSFSRGLIYGGIEGKLEQMRKEASGEAEKERQKLFGYLRRMR